MAAIIDIPITAAGGTFHLDPSLWSSDVVVRLFSAAPINLTGDVIVQLDSDPDSGTHLTIEWDAPSFTLGVFSFTIPGVGLTQLQLDYPGAYVYDFYTSTGSYHRYTTFETTNIKLLGVDILKDASVPLEKLSGLTSAQIIVANAGNIPTAVAMTGDITISNAGVTTIGSAKVTRAMWTALASGKIVVGSAGNLATDVTPTGDVTISNAGVTTIGAGRVTNAMLAAAISALNGGTGINTAASTGFAQVAAGTWSIAALTDIRDRTLSLEADGQGTLEMLFPFPCIVTGINVEVNNTLSGTDDATVTFQDNSATALTGNNLTAGVLTLASGSAVGANFQSTVTANGVFTAGQKLKMITSKVTPGGTVVAQITYTRLTLS